MRWFQIATKKSLGWLVLAICCGVLVVASRWMFSGRRLAAEIERVVNEKARGKLHIGSINWSFSEAPKLLTGGWVAVEVLDVEILDAWPERLTADNRWLPNPAFPRKQLASIPRITAELDVHALLFGNHDYVLRNVVVHGGSVRIEEVIQPYPLHDYDSTTFSILSAFQAAPSPTFRVGIYAESPPPIVDLRDVELRAVDVAMYMMPWENRQGYHVAIDAKQVDSSLHLYVDARDPVVSRVYYALNPSSNDVTLHIEQVGDIGTGAPSDVTLAFDNVQFGRIAQLPTGWPSATVEGALVLDGVVRTSRYGNSPTVLTIGGEIRQSADRPFDGRWDISIDASNLGPVAHEAMDELSGDNVLAQIQLSGPFVAPPNVAFHATGLQYSAWLRNEKAPLVLALDEARGTLDLLNERAILEETLARVGAGAVSPGGAVRLSGRAVLNGDAFGVSADAEIVEAINLAWLDLPTELTRSVGSFVSGHLRLQGGCELTSEGSCVAAPDNPEQEMEFAVTNIDMGLGRTAIRRDARLVGGQIRIKPRVDAARRGSEIRFDALRMTAGETSLSVAGGIDTLDEQVALRVVGESADVDRWLRLLDAPPLAREARGVRIELSGALAAPKIEATATLSGVPIIGELATSVRLEDDTFFVDTLTSSSLGGLITGSALIELGKRTSIRSLMVSGKALDLGRLQTSKDANIRGAIRAFTLEAVPGPLPTTAMGWLARLRGYVASDRFTLLGESFIDSAFCINHPRPEDCRRASNAEPSPCVKGGACVLARATSESGAELDVDVAIGAQERDPWVLGGLQLRQLALESLAHMAGIDPAPAGGRANLAIRLGGTVHKLVVEGALALSRTWIQTALGGDGEFSFSGTNGEVTLAGSLLAGRVQLEAHLALQAPYNYRVTLRLQQLELDSFLDDAMAAALPDPVRGWLSGRISLEGNLESGTPTLWVEVDEAVVSIERNDAEGRPQPMVVRALAATGRPAVSLFAGDGAVAFACRVGGAAQACATKLAIGNEVVELQGGILGKMIDVSLRGTVRAALFEPFVASVADHLGGAITIDAVAKGPLTDPNLTIDLNLDQVEIRPAGQDTVVRAPRGLVRLSQDSLGFADVHVVVDDPALEKQAELVIRGGIGLDGLRPASWGMIIEGRLAGKMLLVALPHLFSQAAGVVDIEENIVLSGRGPVPQVIGALTFPAREPLTLLPRSLRQELMFRKGRIEIASLGSQYDVELSDIVIAVDNEGELRNIAGSAAFRDGQLMRAALSLDAERIAYRVPRTLDVLLSARDISLKRPGPGERWQVAGTVELVSGRFVRNVDVERFRPEAPPAGVSIPFWDQYPELQLGETQLQVAIELNEFLVANNVANLVFGGNLWLTGTPRTPRLNGQIRLKEGTFRLPGTRATFSRSGGTIAFDDNDAFPQDTPVLDLFSESDLRDSEGRDHKIRLSIRGLWTLPDWDLTTSTGLDRQATFALVFSGQAPVQSTREVSASNSDSATTSDDRSQRTLADNLVKDLAGEQLATILGDPIESLIQLDVVRPFITSSSFGVHAEHSFDVARLVGTYEQALDSTSSTGRVDVPLPWKISQNGDPLSVQLNAIKRSYQDQTQSDVEDVQVSVRWRFFIP